MRTLLAFACLAGSVLAADARNVDLRHTDFHFTMPKYGSPPEWEARKAHLRRQILAAAGLYPLPEKTPLHPEISGRMERGDYSIEKVALETMPGYYLGGNLYRPLHPKGKVPAILTPHGHWTYGRLENSEGYSGQALGINLALQGYVAFGYDMVGYNDTLQTEHRFTSPTYQLWSFTPLGLQLGKSRHDCSRRGHGRHVPIENPNLVATPHVNRPRGIQCRTLQPHSAHSYSSAYWTCFLYPKHACPQDGQGMSGFKAWHFICATRAIERLQGQAREVRRQPNSRSNAPNIHPSKNS